MKSVSSQEQTTENEYLMKIRSLISENRSYAIVGAIVLTLICYVFLLRLGQDTMDHIKSALIAKISFTAPQKPQEGVPLAISDKLIDAKIDYISPSLAAGNGTLELNGQISAIASGQVTYHKNKYIVKKGDSLASIAEQVYGDRDAWLRIAKANNLPSPNYIEVGMELVIPR